MQVSFNESIPLPCGSYVEISTGGGRVMLSVEDESYSTELSPDVARQFSAYLADAAKVAEEEAQKYVLRGKSVVLTGLFSGGREKVEQRVRAAGGVVANRVSSASVVVTGRLPEGGTWKSRYAQQVGAQVKPYYQLDHELAAVGV